MRPRHWICPARTRMTRRRPQGLAWLSVRPPPWRCRPMPGRAGSSRCRDCSGRRFAPARLRPRRRRYRSRQRSRWNRYPWARPTAALRPLPRLRPITPASRPSLECSFLESCYRPPERLDRTIGPRSFQIMAGTSLVSRTRCGILMPLRRAGTVPNTEFVTAPALQRTVPRSATRCAASGARRNTQC